MWWPWSSATPVYLARGVIQLGQRRRSPGAGVHAFQCEQGRELEQLAAVVRERPRERFQGFASPDFVVLQSTPRVPGVWRQAERGRAAKALAKTDAEDVDIATVDPSPGSAWVINSYSSATIMALRELNRAASGRLCCFVSYAGFVLSSLLSHARGTGLYALMEDGHLTWAVGEPRRLIAAGAVHGVQSKQVPGECARLALAHGVSSEAVHIVQMHVSKPGVEEATGPVGNPAVGIPTSLPFRTLLRDARATE